jgi:hypothetical protein
MATDKTIYIHINAQKTGYQIQTNQSLSKYDKFKFNEPTPADSYLVADKIADAITYLHTESVRQAGLFEISGNKEIVSMLTDKEFIQGLHPTQYRYKQILSKLLALQSTKGLILVAR